jgi:two-component system response regulator CpxR
VTGPAILVVDDDLALAGMVVDLLIAEAFAPIHAPNGPAALDLLLRRSFDLVIVDVMMPGMDGLQLLRQVRMGGSVPVLMLTARGDENDRVLGLELGADDYLAKPFSARELIARIKAVLRRSQMRNHTVERELKLGALLLDFEGLSVKLNGIPVRLTTAEFLVLDALARSAGRTQTRASLTYQALGRKLEPFDRSIDTHVSSIRRKLSIEGGCGINIKNVRGLGYVLTCHELPS